MNATEDTIRVVLVDDQQLFRQAIATLLAGQPDMEVVGQASGGAQGIQVVQDTLPDVILLDVDMPGCDGIETARRITELGIGARIVMLTVNDEDDLLLSAIRAGAHGYLLKDLHPTDLYEQVRSAAAGHSPISPSLLPRMLDELRNPETEDTPEDDESPHDLSPRELEILQHAAQGLTNREIGRRLYITEGTVKNHIHNSLRKLGLDNRTQAAAFLSRKGLIEVQPQ